MSGRSDAASFEKGAEGVASDAALMARVQAGDRKAFAEIVDRYKDRVLNYLTRLTGCRDRAEDLGQETFLRVFRSADRYEERGQLAALIFRIATNLVTSRRRTNARPPRHRATSFETKRSGASPAPLPSCRCTIACPSSCTRSRAGRCPASPRPSNAARARSSRGSAAAG